MAATTPPIAGPAWMVRAAALLRTRAGFDVALVVGLLALGTASETVLVAPHSESPFEPAPWLIPVWAAGFCLPLLLRRRFPGTVLLVTAVHYLVFWPNGQGNEVLVWLVPAAAVYSVVVYGRSRRSRWAVVAAFGITVVLNGVSATVLGLWDPVQAVVASAVNALPYLVGGGIGVVTRRLRASRAELELRNAELAAQRRANERRAALEERVRIARELHDVVAHHVVLMGIQAGVARRLFDDRPDDARAAVADVESGSRRAVAELQRTIGVLRAATEETDEASDDAATEPSPGLNRLPALVDQVRRAGLPVELTVDGAEVDDGLGLSAYRIVQEALTNTLKHAGPAQARVSVRCGRGSVEVEVVDDGCGPPGPPAGDGSGGRGLVGVRERVAMHGGRLDAGPLDGGGFRVHAVLGDR